VPFLVAIRQLNSFLFNAALIVLSFLHVLQACLSQQTHSVIRFQVRYQFRSGFVFPEFVFPGTLE
jgi:hypothetical protein